MRRKMIVAVMACVCLVSVSVLTMPSIVAAKAVAAEQQDAPLSFKEWKRKAEAGDSLAQFKLGDMYNKGNGVARDYEKAFMWYRKAAEQGNADAMYNMGLMYHFGDGVAKDEKEAEKWYAKAAKQGFAGCICSMGNKKNKK